MRFVIKSLQYIFHRQAQHTLPLLVIHHGYILVIHWLYTVLPTTSDRYTIINKLTTLTQYHANNGFRVTILPAFALSVATYVLLPTRNTRAELFNV